MSEIVDAAQVGKMYVTHVSFEWHEANQKYNDKTGKYDKEPGHWVIGATLNDKPSRYGCSQTMTIKVEHGVGMKLAEVLLPVIIADASQKAQQLADDSKAMLSALGDRALACIADMPPEVKR